MEVEPGLHHSFGEILRAYRKRKRLTQKQLAQVLETHTNTISSWELGTYLPQTRGLVLELARHLGLNDQETRQLLEASLTALSSYWHLPSPRNPFFTGREDILDTLHQCLSTHQASYVLHGLGGVGKTQIAVEYAYRHAQEYTAILWIDAETPESIASSFLSVATLLGLPERQGTDPGRIAPAVQRWLSTHRQWLLIWDNIEDLDLLSSYLPPARQGAMLFTTRRQTLGTLAQGVELQPMMEEEGSLFLLRRARLLDPTAPVEQLEQLAQRTPFEYVAARELVAAMDGLPLALDQVGAYVQETPCSLADYLKLYQTRGAELLKRRGEVVIDHPASVVTTWSISFEKVEQTNAAAAALLRLCAFLHPDAIPEELFVEGTALLGEQLGPVAADVFLWHEAIRAASAYSLLKRNTEEHTLSIHRLVQAVLRERMSEQERELWQQRAIRMLNAFFPEVTPDTQRQCERLLPHVLACAAAMPVQARGRDLAEVLRKAADSLGEHGQYEPTSPAPFVPSTTSHGPTMESAEASVQPELPPSPAQPPGVSSELAQGVSWPPTKVWGPGPNQHDDPSRPPASAPPPPRPRSHLPIVKNWSAWKQVLWMVGYTLLGLVWWIPYFRGFLMDAIRGTSNSEMPAPLMIYLVLLLLLLVPASVLLAGAIFGAWRGGLVITFYTGIVALLIALPLLFWGRAASGSTVISYVVLFCSWPLAALVTGLLYQRHLFRGFGKAYITMLLGISIMVVAAALLLMIAGPSSGSSADVATFYVVVLFFVPITVCLLALPIAVIEVIIQHSIEKAKKGWVRKEEPF
ncbi:MAG TPA: helix-turn-helix domain-containing protein [Ktedonobacteraceae bacterium]